MYVSLSPFLCVFVIGSIQCDAILHVPFLSFCLSYPSPHCWTICLFQLHILLFDCYIFLLLFSLRFLITYLTSFIPFFSFFLLYILHLTVQQKNNLHNQFPSCNALPLNSSFLPQLNFLHIYIALQCFPSGRIERISMFCNSFPQTFRGASYIAYYIACIVSQINYFEHLIYQFLPLLHIHLYLYYSMVT